MNKQVRISRSSKWLTGIIGWMAPLNKFRTWFLAAAIYNLGWGLVVAFFPNLLFEILKMPASNYPSLMGAIGMMVGVYAIGYALIWKDPERFGPLVYVGLAGKVLGPLGFLAAAIQGQLPWRFGWINVFNDVVWLPAFIWFAWFVYHQENLR